MTGDERALPPAGGAGGDDATDDDVSIHAADTDAGATTDKFYHGTIVRLKRGARSGVLRSAAGREIPFTFLHVTMIGPHQRFDDLRVGLSVGYDVSWTSKGLRVSVMRIPD